MNFTISASSMDDLKAQLHAFLAAPAPAPQAPQAPGMPPLPVWAPAGSKWIPLPGAPALEGPNGETLVVDWSDLSKPGVPPAPIVEGPENQAADAAFLKDVQQTGEQQNAVRQAAIDAAAK